jgi:hypothetical protein
VVSNPVVHGDVVDLADGGHEGLIYLELFTGDRRPGRLNPKGD